MERSACVHGADDEDVYAHGESVAGQWEPDRQVTLVRFQLKVKQLAKDCGEYRRGLISSMMR